MFHLIKAHCASLAASSVVGLVEGTCSMPGHTHGDGACVGLFCTLGAKTARDSISRWTAFCALTGDALDVRLAVCARGVRGRRCRKWGRFLGCALSLFEWILHQRGRERSVCACDCVCVMDRERKRERERKRCVCVCIEEGGSCSKGCKETRGWHGQFWIGQRGGAGCC